MKAITYDRYGPPDVLRLAEIPMPVAGDDDVLVRVLAASANAGDWHLMRGQPWLVRPMAGGLRRPGLRALGADLAGQVERVGRNVTAFQPGDPVFGHLAACGFGAFAEYVSAPATALAPKPAGSTFEEAAAIPGAGLAALQGLRNRGRIQPGQHVLVNGASGGVGTFAVQIAKAFGAEVTGVCSGRNVDLVRSIGADHVIDYTRVDVTREGRRYDLILDAAAFRSPWDHQRALHADGRYVMVGGAVAPAVQLMLLSRPMSLIARRTMELLITKPNQSDLLVLKKFVDDGQVRPVIDRRYSLGDVPTAIRYLETGRARGKVVITMNPTPPPGNRAG